MKVIVFGATGSVGRHIVHQALESGHMVTAFVRDPARLNVDHPRLAVARGDVLKLDAVTAAVKGHEAVFCALGDGRKGKIRAAGTAVIVQAMQATGVRRLICQSSLGVGDSEPALNFFWRHIMFGMLLKAAYADHVEQERIVRGSGTDWTIVRPAAFTDGERTKRYLHGFASDTSGLTLKISRADVADFMVEQLDHDVYLYQAPGLSYADRACGEQLKKNNQMVA